MNKETIEHIIYKNKNIASKFTDISNRLALKNLKYSCGTVVDKNYNFASDSNNISFTERMYINDIAELSRYIDDCIMNTIKLLYWPLTFEAKSEKWHKCHNELCRTIYINNYGRNLYDPLQAILEHIEKARDAFEQFNNNVIQDSKNEDKLTNNRIIMFKKNITMNLRDAITKLNTYRATRLMDLYDQVDLELNDCKNYIAKNHWKKTCEDRWVGIDSRVREDYHVLSEFNMQKKDSFSRSILSTILDIINEVEQI